ASARTPCSPCRWCTGHLAPSLPGLTAAAAHRDLACWYLRHRAAEPRGAQMSTTDGGTGPQEPRYGRRRPAGEEPTTPSSSSGQAGQPGGYPPQGQNPSYGQQGSGQPGSYGQQGSGQPGGYGQPGSYGQP